MFTKNSLVTLVLSLLLSIICFSPVIGLSISVKILLLIVFYFIILSKVKTIELIGVIKDQKFLFLFLVCNMVIIIIKCFFYENYTYEDLARAAIALITCMSIGGYSKYNKNLYLYFSLIMFVFGIFSALIIEFGSVYFVPNVIPLFMFPILPSLLFLKCKQVTVYTFSLVVLVFSLYFGARTVTVLTGFFILYVIFESLGKSYLYRVLNLIIALLLFLLFFFIMKDDRFFNFTNQILSNRPFIWLIYLNYIDGLILGSSSNYYDIALSVSGELTYEYSRGFADSYGAHSNFVKIYFKYGVISLITYIIFLYDSLKSKDTPLFTTAILCFSFLTSITIGEPDMFGIFLPLLLFNKKLI